MNSNLDSIYDLITKLCEKYSGLNQNLGTSDNVKNLRKKCYEILLSKTTPSEVTLELENNRDPVCHLIAWEYVLSTKHNLIEHARNIKKCCEKLENVNAFDNPITVNVMMLLLNLRSLPVEENSIMDKAPTQILDDSCKSSLFPSFDNRKFHLSDEDFIYKAPSFETDIFKMGNRRIVYRTTLYENVHQFMKSNKSVPGMIKREIKELHTSCQSLNIWEEALSTTFNSQRTWEEFGNSNPKKETPFLCESFTQTTECVFKLASQQEKWLMLKSIDNIKNMPTSERFVRDVKYLLVGIETNTFVYKDNGLVFIRHGTSLESLTPGALKSYSEDLIFCGRCYKGLDNLCSQNPLTLKETNNGYIFFELCESIKRYLSYYRLAVLSIPNSFNLLMLHHHTAQLRKYVSVLASICKVGPFQESTKIPHGVALLNYLFHQAMSLTDTNLIMVLYSILYPCCQVYFSRFLQQWLLHGSIHDPYGEFFVNVHPKYVTTRGRTYWTRSYSVCEDITPDFIENLSSDILLCGKAMNLLKLCVPNSPLCLYILEKRPDIVSCCLMPEQLSFAERSNYSYYLEATAVCGPRISLSQVITTCKEQSQTQLNLIVRKRLVTLNRIELERKKEREREIERRNSEMRLLQEQYTKALQQKQIKRSEELDANLKTIEQNIRIQNLHNKIIEEESNNLIEYYNKLYEASEVKRIYFAKRAESLRQALDLNVQSKRKNIKPIVEVESLEKKNVAENTSEIFLSLHESSSHYMLATNDDSLNDLNANSLTIIEPLPELIIEDKLEEDSLTKIVNENFEIARRNKAKIMSGEIIVPKKKLVERDYSSLTDAQRNKMKVMSSEFDVQFSLIHNYNFNTPLSILQTNRNRMMASSNCFPEINTTYDTKQSTTICDNENYLNKNVDNINENEIKGWANRKQDKLSLDFSKLSNSKTNESLLNTRSETKLCKSPKFELDKASPMSIDSTPLSSSVTTPSSRLTTNFERNMNTDSCSEIGTTTELTCDIVHSEEGFNFELDKMDSIIHFENRKSAFNLQTQIENRMLKKNISNKDAKAVSSNCLKLYLQQSISFPLTAQLKLVTNELLKFFIKEQGYLNHLTSLRNYFFLLDGEFGRNITENLFKQLYDVNFPMELVNVHTLTVLVYKALDYSTKLQANSQCLSFRINELPQVFDLRDPNVFDCISLTYKTTWPLNILLPSDTISKYDEVFKFLLKLQRISWVLQNVFQDLKSLLKETESRKCVLMTSPQYRRLHQCRHIMMHFIQTFQSYILGEVLFSSWEVFQNHLQSVTNIDELYTLHTNYIKNILFMCLLNQKSAPIQKVIHKIFIVILKFYDYLRSRSWYSVQGVFIHPNFKKLEEIFNNFQELVLYLFKVGDKVVRSGYQPHLLQLLNMLNINNYYNKSN